MILEQGVETVVMVTNLHEGMSDKCTQCVKPLGFVTGLAQTNSERWW
jgi:hypothetical protein